MATLFKPAASTESEIFFVSYDRQMEEASIQAPSSARNAPQVPTQPAKPVPAEEDVDFTWHLRFLVAVALLFVIWAIVFFPILAYVGL